MVTVGLLMLTGFIVNKNRLADVADIEVNIYRNTDQGFLSTDGILSAVNSIDKIKINQIKTEDIEKTLSTNPFIDMVDCYLTIDGRLLINIKEKEPIIRIYDKGNKGFYIDGKGDIFPISRQYAPRAMIANGYINEKITDFNSNIADTIYDAGIFREVFLLTQMINQYSLLKAQINQIYVNSKGEYDLVPELGDHIVQFGIIYDAPDKLRNLDAYYQKYLKTSNWDGYKTINLTYKDQIVCTKK